MHNPLLAYRNKRIFIVILFLLFGCVVLARADTLYLKNGRHIDGIIKNETDAYIELDVGIGVVKFDIDDIQSIHRADKDELDNLLEEWSQKQNAEEEALIPRQQAGETAQQARDILIRDTGNQSFINISINPMIELDFKTKAEIFEIRKQYVFQHPELVNPNYEPSDEVFGSIEDNKPWWGILGICYYGPGKTGIKGLSEQSRFLCNPFLLVALRSPYANIVNNKKLPAKAIYPKPYNLQWRADASLAEVTYDVSTFFKQGGKYDYPSVKERRMDLLTYNAKDLGFPYLYIVFSKSKNITTQQPSRQAVAIPETLHCGSSCGYPGGCNNVSPDYPYYNLTIKKLPARIYIKLWQDAPQQAQQEADMVFILHLK